MAVSGAATGRSRNLILAAMIFAVAMTFIDQTIVSIAVPQLQRELGLSATGVQWVVNAYLLALAALFAFGSRLADTVGHRRMVTLGVIIFAAASALCGLTPKGSLAEAWLVTFRAVQGAGGAIMFPAALAIVVPSTGPPGWGLPGRGPDRQRGRAERVRVPAVGHLGLGESRHLAVHRGGRGAADRVLLRRAAHPVAAHPGQHLPHPAVPGREPRARRVHAGVRPGVLLHQRVRAIALGKTASQAGVFLLFFFIGFVVAAQIGGRMLDRRGAKLPVALGCALAAVGFYLWGNKVTGLSFSTRQGYIVLAGAAWASCSARPAQTR